jgi:hypothetical protein
LRGHRGLDVVRAIEAGGAEVGVEGVQVPACSTPTMLANVPGEFWLLYSVRIQASVRTALPTRTSSS